MTVEGQLEQSGQLNDQQKIQLRMLFAEDMIKKQFVAKTQEVLGEQCMKCYPDVHKCNEKDPLEYSVFEKWMKEMKGLK